MDRECVVASIVALLLLIIAIRKAQRFRFLALYFVFERRQRDLTNSLLVAKVKRLQERRRRRGALARRRRVVWVYPRPQGWFEEMYRNPVMFSLWKNDFRVSKETFDYICQLVGPYLSRRNTCLKNLTHPVCIARSLGQSAIIGAPERRQSYQLGISIRLHQEFTA